MSVAGKGLLEGYLSPEEMAAVAAEGLARLEVDGRRVLVLIPDGTRTMPMPVMFEILERQLGPRVAALDYLVALGTHSPMDDAQLSALVGRLVVGGRAGGGRIFNHRWDDPATFKELGTIPANVVRGRSRAVRLSRTVPVALNRLATVRPRPDLWSRVSSRSRRLFRRDQSCSRGLQRRTSSTLRTGSER